MSQSGAAQLDHYTAKSVGGTQPENYLSVSNPIYFRGIDRAVQTKFGISVVVLGTLIKGAASSLVVKPAPDVKLSLGFQCHANYSS